MEAADLTADAGIPIIIPMHHDTIDGNTGSASALRLYARSKHPQLRVLEVAPFNEITWPAGQT
jgi:hypothetical protein